MTNNNSNDILARLEMGFCTDSAHLKELERDLSMALQCARHFGKKHDSPEDWNTSWHRHWDDVEEILCRIKLLVDEMEAAFESNEHDGIKMVLEKWKSFQSEDDKLVEALSAIRAQARGLNAGARSDWNIQARTLETHLEAIHACALAMRIKLELLKGRSKNEVENFVQGILSELPKRPYPSGIDAKTYELEYRKAAAQLKHEQHEVLGFAENIKTLFTWFESPEERVRRNLSLPFD